MEWWKLQSWIISVLNVGWTHVLKLSRHIDSCRSSGHESTLLVELRLRLIIINHEPSSLESHKNWKTVLQSGRIRKSNADHHSDQRRLEGATMLGASELQCHRHFHHHGGGDEDAGGSAVAVAAAGRRQSVFLWWRLQPPMWPRPHPWKVCSWGPLPSTWGPAWPLELPLQWGTGPQALGPSSSPASSCRTVMAWPTWPGSAGQSAGSCPLLAGRQATPAARHRTRKHRSSHKDALLKANVRKMRWDPWITTEIVFSGAIFFFFFCGGLTGGDILGSRVSICAHHLGRNVGVAIRWTQFREPKIRKFGVKILQKSQTFRSGKKESIICTINRSRKDLYEQHLPRLIKCWRAWNPWIWPISPMCAGSRDLEPPRWLF